MAVVPASEAAISRAGELIRSGELVAFPTETVYGLGADATNGEAVARIFAAKGRPRFNPLIVHVASLAVCERLAVLDAHARTLAQRFWPGPLTLVLPRHPDLPSEISAGLPTVGVRVPAHPVALALLAAADLPIAAPSANLFTRVSPTSAAHVLAQLGNAVDLVLDGGAATVGIESTVVDATGERPVLLRPGGVPAAALESVVGPLLRPAAAGQVPADQANAPRPSPGMIDRHYAPRARLLPFAAADRPRVWRELRAAAAAGTPAGLLAFDVDGAQAVPAIQLPATPAGCAQQLYAALHALDQAGCAVAYIEMPPPEPGWEAVLDRLRRAGHG